MEGESNNNNVEMHQPEGPIPPHDDHRRRIVSLIVGLVVIIAIVVWIGNWAMEQKTTTSPSGLTDAQKAEILKSLQAPPNTPPLTDAQKAEILESLQAPPPTPPLTDAQKAEIMKLLE